MRLPKILMGSLLLFPLACGGGDDGGDDATLGGTNPTGPATSGPSTMTADDDGMNTTDGGNDDAMATTAGDGPMETTDDGPADGTTTGGPGDETTAGDDTTGGAATACEMFCADFFANEFCDVKTYNDFGSEGDCATECDTWEKDLFTCKVEHLGLANSEPNAFHCGHANAAGNCPP